MFSALAEKYYKQNLIKENFFNIKNKQIFWIIMFIIMYLKKKTTLLIIH